MKAVAKDLEKQVLALRKESAATRTSREEADRELARIRAERDQYRAELDKAQSEAEEKTRALEANLHKAQAELEVAHKAFSVEAKKRSEAEVSVKGLEEQLQKQTEVFKTQLAATQGEADEFLTATQEAARQDVLFGVQLLNGPLDLRNVNFLLSPEAQFPFNLRMPDEGTNWTGLREQYAGVLTRPPNVHEDGVEVLSSGDGGPASGVAEVGGSVLAGASPNPIMIEDEETGAQVLPPVPAPQEAEEVASLPESGPPPLPEDEGIPEPPSPEDEGVPAHPPPEEESVLTPPPPSEDPPATVGESEDAQTVAQIIAEGSGT